MSDFYQQIYKTEDRLPMLSGLELGLLILCMASIVVMTTKRMDAFTHPAPIPEAVLQDSKFRAMQISPEAVSEIRAWAEAEELDWIQALAVIFSTNEMDLSTFSESMLPDRSDYLADFHYYKDYEQAQFEKLYDALNAIYADLIYFPVAKSMQTASPWISYVDSWGFERTYGGKRSHEGCDVMGERNEPDYYPVVSMTDGIVEQMGWLEKGGWRIGIRSKNGGYFYYAHLSRYDTHLKKGDTVSAGQLLGYMGNTGYSKVEGTAGNFDVHLHMGIYIAGSQGEEISTNPYWILKMLEGCTVTADY